MKVGFVGLGSVGGKLAGSVLRNGFELAVHDLDKELVAQFVARGAVDGGSPAALMASCDVMITCLPSPQACEIVVEEMLPSVTQGKIWLEMSTTDAKEIQRLGAAVQQRGGFAVDCPVSGVVTVLRRGIFLFLQDVIAQHLIGSCRC